MLLLVSEIKQYGGATTPLITINIKLLLISIINLFTLIKFCNCIDENEKLGYCKHHIDINVNDHVTAYEGIWFPQYRSIDEDNYQYTCHTLYERVYYEDKKPTLIIDSYYTLDGIPQTALYEQSYKTSEKRGVTIDDEGVLDGYGQYNVYNYILKLTPEYRVRYICTDYIDARRNVTMVYIETRSMTPSYRIIKQALNVLKEHQLYVKLDRIEQRHCKRPLGPEGYVPLDKEKKSLSRDNQKP